MGSPLCGSRGAASCARSCPWCCAQGAERDGLQAARHPPNECDQPGLLLSSEAFGQLETQDLPVKWAGKGIVKRSRRSRLYGCDIYNATTCYIRDYVRAVIVGEKPP